MSPEERVSAALLGLYDTLVEVMDDRDKATKVTKAINELVTAKTDAAFTALVQIEKFGHSEGHGRGYTCADIAAAALHRTGEAK